MRDTDKATTARTTAPALDPTSRKNWIFADTVRGAQVSANPYSPIGTAKPNGLELFACLRHVFTELPDATTLDEVELLLPRLADLRACKPPATSAQPADAVR